MGSSSPTMALFTLFLCLPIFFACCSADNSATPPPLPPGPPPPPEASQDEFVPESDLPLPPPSTSYTEHLAGYQEILDKLNWLNSTDLEQTQLREGDWTAAFDVEENGWYFFNNVTNISTWDPPEEFKALYLAHELRNADDAGRLDERGIIYVNGLELTNGGNFTQALKDNIKEQKFYENIVKDFIEAYAIKTVGWLGLNVILYGGSMFWDGFGTRKKRDTSIQNDYFGGVNRALESSQTWKELIEKAEEEGRDWENIIDDTMIDVEEDLEALFIKDLDKRHQLEASIAYPIFKFFGVD